MLSHRVGDPFVGQVWRLRVRFAPMMTGFFVEFQAHKPKRIVWMNVGGDVENLL